MSIIIIGRSFCFVADVSFLFFLFSFYLKILEVAWLISGDSFINVPQKLGVPSSPELLILGTSPNSWWPQNIEISSRFQTTLRLDHEHLWNAIGPLLV